MRKKKDRVANAINAVKAAKEEGVGKPLIFLAFVGLSCLIDA